MAQDHIPAELSEEQRANLTKLAAYLCTLPVEYPDFAMDDYTSDGSRFAAKHECGTAACAAGHGVNAGVMPFADETWSEYSERCFAPDDWSDVSPWHWCFHASWARTDNTAHGAAARIEYMLVNGVPENAPEQIRGRAPLSYIPQVSA